MKHMALLEFGICDKKAVRGSLRTAEVLEIGSGDGILMEFYAALSCSKAMTLSNKMVPLPEEEPVPTGVPNAVLVASLSSLDRSRIEPGVPVASGLGVEGVVTPISA